jgi:hypothetical protein
MALAIMKILTPTPGQSAQRFEKETDQTLHVAVVFTTFAATLVALKQAGDLASNLGARISLFAAHVVPYPMTLEAPQVPPRFYEDRLRLLARESAHEMSAYILLCRDDFEALTSALTPGSIVVLGGPRRRWTGRWTWWPTKEQQLARRLHSEGYQVLFSEME